MAVQCVENGTQKLNIFLSPAGGQPAFICLNAVMGEQNFGFLFRCLCESDFSGKFCKRNAVEESTGTADFHHLTTYKQILTSKWKKE